MGQTPASTGGSARHPRIRTWLVPAAIYAAVSIVSTWPLAWHPRALLGAALGPGDPYLNIWSLGWGMHAVLNEPLSLLTGRVFDANIFHPAGGTLAYSDHLLLQAVVLAPLYALTGDAVLCYNVLLLASLVFSALAMHACVRSLIGSEGGAYVAGLAWGFGSYRFAHLPHLQLQALYFLPLTVLYLHKVVAGRRLRDAMALGLFTGLQAISSVYYAVIGGVGLVVGGVTLIITAVRRGRSRVLSRMVLAAAVAVLLVLPVTLVYWRVQQEQGFGRNLAEAAQGAARVTSYLQVPAGNVVYGRSGLLHEPSTLATAAARGPERELFPGFVLVALAIIGFAAGVRSDARPIAATMGVLAAVGAVLSLGPDGIRPLYAALHQVVFGFQAIRAPARFSVLLFFGLAMLASLGWREVFGRAHGFGKAWPRWTSAVVMALAAAEWAHVPTTLAPAPALETAVGQWLRVAPGTGAVVVLPLAVDIESTPVMVQSLEHRRRLINGYSGQRPDFYPALVDVLSTFPSDEALLTLHDREVQYVVTDEPIAVADDSGLSLRANLGGHLVYELAVTPEIEARLTSRSGDPPPEPGPIPFAVGEQSEYSVQWDGALNVEAGRVTVSVEPPAFRLSVRATTAPWVSRFFEADDRFVTTTDARLIPLTHARDQREGSRHVSRGFVYDWAERVVRIGPSLDAARGVDATTLPLAGDARDAIAALFYVRTLALAPGVRYDIPINEAGRSVRLALAAVGVETVTVQGRPQRAWRLEPTLRQRVERRRPVAASVWVSDDGRRLPLLVTVNAPFGRLRMELVAHRSR